MCYIIWRMLKYVYEYKQGKKHRQNFERQIDEI